MMGETEKKMVERVITIPADHPCLPGHFPGRPLVPAVIILDEIRAIMAEVLDREAPIAVDHCKFQGFVLPDQPFDASLAITANRIVDFTCKARDDDRVLAKGRLRLEPHQE